MMAIRRFAYTVWRHPAFAGVIIVVLPIILAACTNGGSSGSGY
jgi:hypothetical protein